MINLSFAALAGPSLLAGLLTFLAPCTLPLLPAYLGFISGLSFKDLSAGQLPFNLKWRVFKNGLWYVFGFSLVFIALGSLFGWAGSLLGAHRFWLARWGGLLVVFFGLFLIWGDKWTKLSFLQKNVRWSIFSYFTPGQPLSSFLLGVVFALGWTPCVGPILGSVLLLASSQATLLTGAALLLVFSVGLAIPFLLVAAAIGSIGHYLRAAAKYLRPVAYLGGLLLVALGCLMLFDKFGWWATLAYKWFGWLNYQSLLDYM